MIELSRPSRLPLPFLALLLTSLLAQPSLCASSDSSDSSATQSAISGSSVTQSVSLNTRSPAFSSSQTKSTTTFFPTIAPSTTTNTVSTMPNRITYQDLPTCVQSCIRKVIDHIPATPFVAESFCGLPTGKYAYELPEECVATACGAKDKDAESSWKKSICKGVKTVEPTATVSTEDGELRKRQESGTASATDAVSFMTASSAAAAADNSTSPSSVSSASASGAISMSTTSESTTESSSTTEPIVIPTLTQGVCAKGYKACPAGLNGGCCPQSHTCNLYDCEPPSASASKKVYPDLFDITTFFPPCSHDCLRTYLPLTSCSLSPLNITCFCRLTTFTACMREELCPSSEAEKFAERHADLCQGIWYFKPYAKSADRWCDLPGAIRPVDYDERYSTNAFKGECPNFWQVRSGGKRFGIVLGFMIATVLLVWGCCGYWVGVARALDKREERKRREKTQGGVWNTP